MPEVSAEILGKLHAFAAANGIDLGIAPLGSDAGDEKPVFPIMNLNRAVSEIAHETGLNLKRSGLYLYNGRLVTVEEDGSTLDMDSKRFRTWIDRFQLNFKKRRKKANEDDDTPGAPIKETIKKDVAEVLLASDEFLCHIPQIKRLVPVRLPVWDEEAEVRGVRLLNYGYDAKTKIYTADTGIDYAIDWPLEKAVEYLRKLLKDFPFADAGRSLAVQISGMLTTFCQLLFAERDRLPMLYFNANTPGSGKSRLAEICIYFLYGTAESVTYSENDEFVKKLDTWSQRGLSYTFLDDVSGLVKSNELNKWLTFPTWSGRKMHSQVMFTVFNQTLTLMTGNQATLSDDLGRRSLMIDLWSARSPEDREDIGTVIDTEWLAAAANRKAILSAMHALVTNWAVEHECRPHGKLIPSFEGWSRIVPAIVTAAGFECPVQRPEVRDAGQKQEIEFRQLLAVAVESYKDLLDQGKPVDILLTDWAAMARWKGLFYSVIGDLSGTREVMDSKPMLYKEVKHPETGELLRPQDDEGRNKQAYRYLDKGQQTKFGTILFKFYRGQERKIDGIWYRFGKRDAKYSTFTIERLGDAAAAEPALEAHAAEN